MARSNSIIYFTSSFGFLQILRKTRCKKVQLDHFMDSSHYRNSTMAINDSARDCTPFGIKFSAKNNTPVDGSRYGWLIKVFSFKWKHTYRFPTWFWWLSKHSLPSWGRPREALHLPLPKFIDFSVTAILQSSIYPLTNSPSFLKNFLGDQTGSFW